MTDKRNFIIILLGLVILGLVYFNRLATTKLAISKMALVAANDTVHKFKTSNNNQGAYITTIIGDRDNLIELLKLKSQKDSSLLAIIDSLKKDKSIKSANLVTTNTIIKYTHKIDTLYSKIDFKDSIRTKWWDLNVDINKGEGKYLINTRDELTLTNKLVPNKGLFTGKTLTTYATSNNPNTDIIGLTSISTVIDKRKPRIGFFIGPAILTTFKDNKLNAGIAGGIGLTF